MSDLENFKAEADDAPADEADSEPTEGGLFDVG